MASTSASSIQKSFKYDVFLSFRGKDTRKNFIDHLYHALQHKSIYTYRDDEEIKKGKRINDELIRSIEDSKFYIIVFSKNYASSSWCLDELVKIMECQKTNEHIAFPVFFDVEPTEVRKQSGAVGEAFAKHKELDISGKWRDALKEAADLAGWELKNTFDGHEAQLVKKIVEEISLELRPINYGIDEKLVGMEERVKDVVSSLAVDIEDVRLIGIKGMGGAGKTTLARAVFDQISYQFEGSSFVENVREVSKGSIGGLKSLQKQVLSDVLNKQDITVNGVYQGKSMMKDRMRGVKALLVLDDVDLLEQLEALAGDPNWFKLGSRVIITTRDKQVLEAHRVNLILDVNLLSHKEAICLFSKYAFGREIPIQGYENLSKQVVSYAAGLPLTIRVLGSFLCGKDELEWTDALDRQKTIPLKETLEILELSYNSLEEDYKEIFLDVACILKGWEKEKAIIALESCGFHARSGLKVLEQKSLLTSSSGWLSMHDHIEEMGKNIVRRLHPKDPYRHSRLWIQDEVEDILVEDKGSEATRCLTLNLPVESVILMNGLKRMKELRFLEVIYNDFDDDTNIDYNEDSQYLPNCLKYLSLVDYPFSRLPKGFQANDLVGFTLCDSTFIHQLWEGGEKKVLKKLRSIDLFNCSLRTLDFALFPNLEWLYISGCWNLEELHMHVKNFKLKYFNLCHYEHMSLDLVGAQNLNNLIVKCGCLLKLQMPVEALELRNVSLHCHQLKTLNLTGTPNLETLEVEECGDLVEIHMPVESLKLKNISLQCCKLKTLNLTHTLNLETLIVEECEDLVELHMPVESLKLKHISLRCCKLKTLNLTQTLYLETLKVEECEDLDMPIESLKLKHLSLRCCTLKTLNLTQSLSLEILKVEACGGLVELHMPDENLKLERLSLQCCKLKTLNLRRSLSLETIKVEECGDLVEIHMPIESLKLKSVSLQYCFMLETIDLGLISNLERLDIKDCYNLVEIRAPVGCLKRLVRIKLTGCIRFKPILVNPWFPDFGSSAELHLIARSLDICPLHPDNNLPKFQFECIYKERLPSSIGNLEKLLSFGLCACTNLARFSGSICSLQCLRKLTLEGSILEVPKEIDRLECLEELALLSTYIKHFPDSNCMLKHLKVLRLKSCWFLEQLPENLGRLECLEELHLTECVSLRHIPNSVCEMKRLKCFHLPYCVLVEKLPEEIGGLKCLEELNIEGTGISHLPLSIFQLKGLLIIGSMWRLESYGFTTLLEKSNYTSCCYI
ncbi:TMV resistance protein N-like [Bidens hawaiensis]|uniref:TMV resistance protein N-like n=1 Tax=Bidens hawaiensis TaxID=980011 RepID=UPI00404ADFE2